MIYLYIHKKYIAGQSRGSSSGSIQNDSLKRINLYGRAVEAIGSNENYGPMSFRGSNPLASSNLEVVWFESHPRKNNNEILPPRGVVRVTLKVFRKIIRNLHLENFYGSCLKPKTISSYTKENVFIKQFNSVKEASEWVFENGKCKTLNSGVRGHISDCANGKQSTAYGYIWKYN